MPVNFDFNDLYAFRALMEYGSFRLAAESICLSQSALSRRIEKLETALGSQLFDRTTRQVTLTRCGQNFAERSEQLLAHVRDGAGGYQPGQQGAHRAGDGGDGAFRRLLLLCRKSSAAFRRVIPRCASG